MKRVALRALASAVLLLSLTVSAAPRAVLVAVDPIADPARDAGKPGGAANCSNDDPAKYSGLYGLTGWKVTSPTTAHLNSATVPSGLMDAVGAMQRSFDAWLVGPSVPRITVVSDGTATKATANHTDDLLFGRTGGSIATTYTWRWSDGSVESDVVFNKGYGWFQAASEGDGCVESAGARYDWENIAVHEFGHVYGLDHPSGSRYESMHAYGYTGETLKRSPATGDATGAGTLYV